MPRRILVVDDDESVRFVMRRVLRNLDGGCEVVTASSGGEALDRVGEGTFDLVITDLRMPGIDGIRLTEALRARDARPTIVWMTAYGCDDVRAAAGRLGVDLCLDKPLEVEEIRALVMSALERAGPARPTDKALGESGEGSGVQTGAPVVA